MRHGSLSAEEIISLLDMKRHPEGGWYAETFRDNPGGGRGHSTAIYFLLKAGEISAWHRVDAAEVWHHYAGAAVEVTISQDGRRRFLSGWGSTWRLASVRRSSSPLAGGRRPGQPATGRWSAARWLQASIFLASNWRRPAGGPGK